MKIVSASILLLIMPFFIKSSHANGENQARQFWSNQNQMQQQSPESQDGYTNSITLMLEPISMIPESLRFVSENRYIFDMSQLRRTIESMKAFINPYTMVAFSEFDQNKILRHPSGLGEGLLKYVGPQTTLKPTRPEIVGTLQIASTTSTTVNAEHIIRWFGKVWDDSESFLGSRVVCRNHIGEITFNSSLRQLLVDYSATSCSQGLEHQTLKACLQTYVSDLHRVSEEAAAAGELQDSQEELFTRYGQWQYFGVTPPEKKGYFSKETWAAMYKSYSDPSFRGGTGGVNGTVGKGFEKAKF